MAETIPLSQLPRSLKVQYGQAVSYRKLYMATLDGDLPAEKADDGRWYVQRADLHDIAKAFGLTADRAA